jgi:RNA polymerase primary sigma factor
MIQIARRCKSTRKLSERAASRLRDRAERLLQTEIDFIGNKSFCGVERDLEPKRFDSVLEEPAKLPPKNLPGHLARLCETPVLGQREERELFRRMNYLKYRANVLRAHLDPSNPDPETVSRAERMLATALATRDKIIKANMRLAISVVKKFVSPQHSFDELLSDGIFSLMQAVDKFDYDRGFRFSTYAYRAIARNAYRSVTRRQKDSVRFATDMLDSNAEETDDRSSSAMNVQTWTQLRTALSRIMDRLDRREQLIIRCRYALGAHRKVKTFQAIAEKLGVSKERVRQLEQRAMSKLRTMADQMAIDELAETPVRQ